MQRFCKQNEQDFFPPCAETSGPGLQGKELRNLQMGILPKVYFCIVHCVKLLKKQGLIIESICCNYPQWILTFCKYTPSNLFREATLAIAKIIRVLKLMTYEIKAFFNSLSRHSRVHLPRFPQKKKKKSF